MEYYNVFYTDKVLIQILASSSRSAEGFARQIKKGVSIESITPVDSDRLNYFLRYTNGTGVYVAASSKRDAEYYGKYIQPGSVVSSIHEVPESNSDNEYEQNQEYAEEMIHKLREKLTDKEVYIISQNAVYDLDTSELKNEIERLTQEQHKLVAELQEALSDYDIYTEFAKIEDADLRHKLYYLFNHNRLNLLEAVFLFENHSDFSKSYKRTMLAIIRALNKQGQIECGYNKLIPSLHILYNRDYGDLNNKKEMIRQLHLSH
jgi:hypothetical protein